MFSFPDDPHLWLSIGLVFLWLTLVLLLAEALNRFAGWNAEMSRKVVHIGTGPVILLAWWLHIPAWIGIGAGTLAGILAAISHRINILPSVNSVGRQTWGTFFYGISVGILIAWFWPQNSPQYAAIGILVMALGDGFAAVIGQKFGRHPYQIWGMNKSWEGSLTMLIISYSVTSLILLPLQGPIATTWIVALITAGAATSLESFSKYGIDNLTVPVGSAAISFWLLQALP